MSFANPLVLSPDSPTDVDTGTNNFDLRAADIGYSEYSVGGVTPPSSKVLVISHETDKNGVLRHLAKIDYVLVDAFGVPATLSVKFNIVRPPNTAITNGVIIGTLFQLIDFLIEGGAGANVTRLLNQEV
jgi:hypothetical protein